MSPRKRIERTLGEYFKKNRDDCFKDRSCHLIFKPEIFADKQFFPHLWAFFWWLLFGRDQQRSHHKHPPLAAEWKIQPACSPEPPIINSTLVVFHMAQIWLLSIINVLYCYLSGSVGPGIGSRKLALCLLIPSPPSSTSPQPWAKQKTTLDQGWPSCITAVRCY